MIKSFIEKKLKSFLAFVEINFKIRFGNKSAVDIYYDELQKNCYEFFKKDMQESSIFLKVEDIRNFSIYRAIQGLNNSDNNNFWTSFFFLRIELMYIISIAGIPILLST